MQKRTEGNDLMTVPLVFTVIKNGGVRRTSADGSLASPNRLG